MASVKPTILLLLLAISFMANAQQNSILYFKSNGNPIITHKFTCDPATLVVGDTLWLFTGHDSKGGQGGYNLKDWCVFSTTDLVNWTEYPTPLKITDFSWDKTGAAYASHVVERNGKYYGTSVPTVRV
jgi:beta-xylosidase